MGINSGNSRSENGLILLEYVVMLELSFVFLHDQFRSVQDSAQQFPMLLNIRNPSINRE